MWPRARRSVGEFIYIRNPDVVNNIPLFPLQSVLFPSGRMALQIFEVRYIDLIRDCMRNDTGFGVVRLLSGGEVADQRGHKVSFDVTGCYARIVDWHALQSGRLGIVIEGEKLFDVIDHVNESNGLITADVEWNSPQNVALNTDIDSELVGLYQKLIRHPEVAKLGYSTDIKTPVELSMRLAQLLPMDAITKQALLVEPNCDTRVAHIQQLLRELGGG